MNQQMKSHVCVVKYDQISFGSGEFLGHLIRGLSVRPKLIMLNGFSRCMANLLCVSGEIIISVSKRWHSVHVLGL